VFVCDGNLRKLFSYGNGTDQSQWGEFCRKPKPLLGDWLMRLNGRSGDSRRICKRKSLIIINAGGEANAVQSDCAFPEVAKNMSVSYVLYIFVTTAF